MAKRENINNPEDNSEESPEQAEVSKQLREMAEQESRPSRQIAGMPEGVEPFNPKRAAEELLSDKKPEKNGSEETPKEREKKIMRWNEILHTIGDNLSMVVDGENRVTISENGEDIGRISPLVGFRGFDPDSDFQKKAQELVEWGWQGKSGGIRRKKR